MAMAAAVMQMKGAWVAAHQGEGAWAAVYQAA